MRRTWIVLSIAVAVLSCASNSSPPGPSTPGGSTPAPPPVTASPVATPAVPLEEGSSPEAAVLVEASTERAGVDWENDWIFRRYGKFRKKTVALAGQEGRRLDVVTVELADHSEKVLYFDISNFFGK